MNIKKFTTLRNAFISSMLLVAEGKDVSTEPELMLKVYKDGKGSNKRDKTRFRDEDLIKIIQEIENGYRVSPTAQYSTLPPIPSPIEYPPPTKAQVNPKPTNSPNKNNQNKPSPKPDKSNQPKPTNKPNNNNQNKPNTNNNNQNKPNDNNQNKPTNKPNNNNQTNNKNPTKKPTNNQNNNKNSSKKPTKRPTKDKNSPTNKPINRDNSNNNEPSFNIGGRSKNESKHVTKIQLVPSEEEIAQDLFCETAFHRASDSLGSCFEINNKGGCSNIECEDMICKTIGDAFCCDAIWDENCVESAKVFCAHDTTGIFAQTSSCYSYSNLMDPGCSNKSCEKFVCDMLPGCCSTSWNWDCVVAAFDYCCLEDFEN